MHTVCANHTPQHTARTATHTATHCMHCNTHRKTLCHPATQCNALQHTHTAWGQLSRSRIGCAWRTAHGMKGTVRGGVLQCVAVCCSVLQCITVRCSVLQGVRDLMLLQCVAVRRRTCVVYRPRHETHYICGCVAVWCSGLWCIAVCCSVLQCNAECCSVLR